MLLAVPAPDAGLSPYDGSPLVDGSLALAPVLVTRRERLRLAEPSFDSVRTPRRALVDPHRWGEMVARAVLEVISGDRPASQLMRWATPDVYDEITLSICPRGPRPWAASLRRLLVCEPVPGVAEVTAVVDRGGRSGALALRFEGVDGRWLLTAVHLG